MPTAPSRTLLQGAIAGLIAGLVVAFWFLLLDLATAEPFHTPLALASAIVGAGTESPVRLIAMYTLLHFVIFALLGMAAASILRAANIAPGLLPGAIFGLGVLNAVHYGTLILTGTGALTVLPPLHVLAANVVGGAAMFVYLHYAMRDQSRLGLANLRDHPLLTRGIITGMIGAGVVAVWFLILDIVRGQPFYTPGALGSIVFLGAAGPGDVRIDPAVIAAYTLFHLVSFAALGVLLEWSAERLERTPSMWMIALLILIISEGLFIATAFGVTEWVLGTLGYWAVGVANVLALASMGWWIWSRHPRLRDALIHTPEVRTRV